MKRIGVFSGKKIFLISPNEELAKNYGAMLRNHGAVFFHSKLAHDAIVSVIGKKPDLVIFDEAMPLFNGSKILSILRPARPQGKVLLLTHGGVPMRSIDVTAQGISYSIPKESPLENAYNAVKHCLAISSVPRVEPQAV